MLSSADSHEASGTPGQESWRPHLALLPWAKPLANPSGRAVPPWVPICSLWWRRCVPRSQSTTRPSEGPCCSLGQGSAGVGGSRIAGFLHSMPIRPISVVLSVWYLLCTATCEPVLGGVEVDNASRWIAIPPRKRHGTCVHRQRPMLTVYSTTHNVFWVLRLTGPSTGQM